VEVAAIEPLPSEPAPLARLPEFATPEILWYFGGLAAAVAADSVIAGTSTANRGLWILLVGLAAMGFFGLIAAALFRIGRPIPGGVMAAAVVLVVPYTEVGFERLFGVHPKLGSPHVNINVVGDASSVTQSTGSFHGALFAIALGTVIIALAVFWLTRAAFVFLPMTVALVVTAELLLPALVNNPSAADEITTALITGVVFAGAGMLLDARDRRRDAFWWFVVGLFLIALSFLYYIAARHHAWVWLVLLVVSGGVLVLSAPLRRATWAVYALIGLYATLVHFVVRATGSWHSPFLLVLVGLGLVLLGLVLETAGPAAAGRFKQPSQPPPV
jgi:hypothetical protein